MLYSVSIWRKLAELDWEWLFFRQKCPWKSNFPLPQIKTDFTSEQPRYSSPTMWKIISFARGALFNGERYKSFDFCPAIFTIWLTVFCGDFETFLFNYNSKEQLSSLYLWKGFKIRHCSHAVFLCLRSRHVVILCWLCMSTCILFVKLTKRMTIKDDYNTIPLTSSTFYLRPLGKV